MNHTEFPLSAVQVSTSSDNESDWEGLPLDLGTTTLSVAAAAKSPIMSRGLYEAILTIIGYTSLAMGVSGIVSNILIVITYVKIGVTNSINTSYVAMAVSDLFCVLHTMWYMILVIPHLDRAAATRYYIAKEILAATAGFPQLAFAKTTAWITAYIALERCLCVASPHKVKVLFTKKLTLGVILVIYFVSVTPAPLAYLSYQLEWKPSPRNPNKTVLGTYFSTSRLAYHINEFLDAMYGLAYTITPIVIIFLCSVFLIVHLQASSHWRRKSTHDSTHEGGEKKNNPNSKKEDRIIKVVLFIAILTFVLNIPLICNFATITIDPSKQPYTNPEPNLMDISATFATACTLFNSVFNIFIYYKLGTKFRTTLRFVLRLDKKA